MCGDMKVSGVDFPAVKLLCSSRFVSFYPRLPPPHSEEREPLAGCEPPVSLEALAAVADASGVTISQRGQDAAVSHYLTLHVCMFYLSSFQQLPRLAEGGGGGWITAWWVQLRVDADSSSWHSVFPAASAVVQRHLGQINEHCTATTVWGWRGFEQFLCRGTKLLQRFVLRWRFFKLFECTWGIRRAGATGKTQFSQLFSPWLFFLCVSLSSLCVLVTLIGRKCVRQ